MSIFIIPITILLCLIILMRGIRNSKVVVLSKKRRYYALVMACIGSILFGLALGDLHSHAFTIEWWIISFIALVLIIGIVSLVILFLWILKKVKFSSISKF